MECFSELLSTPKAGVFRDNFLCFIINHPVNELRRIRNAPFENIIPSESSCLKDVFDFVSVSLPPIPRPL